MTDLFGHNTTRNRAEALAALDAWLAATKDLHPLDPGYWPPPVAFHEWQKPRAEKVNRGAATAIHRPKTRARGQRFALTRS